MGDRVHIAGIAIVERVRMTEPILKRIDGEWWIIGQDGFKLREATEAEIQLYTLLMEERMGIRRE